LFVFISPWFLQFTKLTLHLVLNFFSWAAPDSSSGTPPDSSSGTPTLKMYNNPCYHIRSISCA
jgi:hypothetical protein